jgi:hypothetical protein
MSWWTAVVNGTKMIGDSAAWAWNQTPVKRAVNYVADTACYVLEQGLAARKAFPALATPSAWKIVEGMGNIIYYDVLLIVGINFINNGIQNFFREGHDEEQAGLFAPYAIFLSGLSLINYGVSAYSYRQGAKLLVHTLVLDSLGPSAFNEFKAKLPNPPTLCIEEECNFKRKFKGSLREPLQLAANDMVLWAISKFPYGGEQAAWILAIYFYGEYITRMATPERCERHKAMKSESVLALGIGYTTTSAILDHILSSTVGIPPYLYHRTLNHILLLLHINLASHMNLPLVKPQKNTFPIDPLALYERSSRFALDVVFAGLMKRIPIDFKTPPGSKPFIPLSTVLKFLTKILDSDLEQVRVNQPGFFKQAMKQIVPSTFHNPKNVVNDPVIKLFWPDIQKGILYTIEIVEAAGKPVASLTTGPKPLASAVKLTLPMALNYRFGLPIKLSEFLLSLSKKEDFWDFVTALKHWLERNNVSYDIILTKKIMPPTLHGDTKIIELPSDPKLISQLPPANELQAPSTPKVPDARSLMPKKVPPMLKIDENTDLATKKPPTLITANSLFSTRQRPTRTAVNNGQPKVEEESLLQSSF